MHLENLGFEDTNADSIFEIIDKNTQTNENAVKQSDCSTKSYKLPVPRDLDEPNEGEVKSFEFSQAPQDPGCPKSVTVVRGTKTEESHPNSNSPSDKGFSNRHRYCKEVIKPFLQDFPPDNPDSKELLLRDGVVKDNADFPESPPNFERVKPCPVLTCLPPPKSPSPCPPKCPPPKRPSPCPPKCPPPKCPSPRPPRYPPPCSPPKCPSPCPPRCPPPKCPPQCPLKNHLKIICGEEGPTIYKECTRATCPSYTCPNPYNPPPCATCPPPCPPCRSPCPPPKSPPRCPPPKCPSPRCPSKSPPPCPPPKCPSPCPPRCPPPCPPPKCPSPCHPPKCPSPCRPPKCPSPCPPRCPPRCPPSKCPSPCPTKGPPPCPPPKCLSPCPPPKCPTPCPPRCPPPCLPPKCPSPCPPRCPPPGPPLKCPSPCPPKCPSPCPPKCPSPCPPKCPSPCPPKCPSPCPPKCPPPCPPPKCPSPCPPKCPPPCPLPKCPSPCPPRCPPPCPPPKCKALCPPKYPPPCPPVCPPPCPPPKCPSPCPPSCPPPCPPPKCPSPCPPRCPPPCPPPKCLAPCPPKCTPPCPGPGPPSCLTPCDKKDPNSNPCCLEPSPPKSNVEKLLQTLKKISGETLVCKCCNMSGPRPPSESPTPPCPPPPSPPPQCPPPQCPPPQCPPPQCPPPQCPPPQCPPPQCPPPQCPPPQCPPPCPPPQCSPQCSPPCPPPECPPPECPPPCPPPQCPPCPPCPPCPGLTIERKKQPSGCDVITRSERKFLCPSECPNSKASSKTKLTSAKPVSSTQCVCTDEAKIQSAIDAHHETLATLKCAVTDLVCKAYRSTQDAATIICDESAKQLDKIKKSASSLSSDCLSPKEKPPCPTSPKKVSNTRSGTSLRRLSVVNLNTSHIEDIEDKARPCPEKSETNYSQSKNPLGFIFDKVESAVSMISDSLVFELPKPLKPRTYNDSSSKYDVPTPPPNPPSPTDVENVMFPAGTSQLFSTIKDKIWSMFTEDDKTNVSSRRSSTATLATDSDEDLMTRIID